ncbi:hypothetical protein LCGC14_0412660 [marine sediment metagenome]|uniref:Uncharacterized protein n=1 Tax=marine sediment metagenome TaxID=412755 RepID=A0A0F9STN7_9ZZZZ
MADKTDCGCRATSIQPTRRRMTTEVKRCRLHDAAPKLLEILGEGLTVPLYMCSHSDIDKARTWREKAQALADKLKEGL